MKKQISDDQYPPSDVILPLGLGYQLTPHFDYYGKYL